MPFWACKDTKIILAVQQREVFSKAQDKKTIALAFKKRGVAMDYI